MTTSRTLRATVSVLAAAVALAACSSGARERPPAREPATLVTLPDVRGRDIEGAKAALEGAGVVVGAVEAWPDSLGYPARTVVAQRPAKGALVPAGSPVDLRVYGISDADARRLATPPAAPLPPSVPPLPPEPPPSSASPAPEPPRLSPAARGTTAAGPVPDLVGLSLDEATAVARRAGFDVVALRVAGRPKDRVLSQNTAAGRSAPLGTVVGVRVATGED